jgi:hypothetical protein
MRFAHAHNTPISSWAGKTDHASAVSNIFPLHATMRPNVGSALAPIARIGIALVWRTSLHSSNSLENITRVVSLLILYVDFF